MRRPLIVVAGALAALALAAPAAKAAACPEQPLERTFLPWLDPAWYHPAPDGGFEAGGSWTLTGGAAVVEGNQPYLDGSQSLDLPGGVDGHDGADLRHGRPSHDPAVRAQHAVPRWPRWSSRCPSARCSASSSTLPVGVVLSGEQWSPTLPLLVVGNLLSREARFKFTLRARAARGRSTTSSSIPTARAERVEPAARGRRAGALRPPRRRPRRGGRRSLPRRARARPRRRRRGARGVQTRGALTSVSPSV